jgi:hypothetical protein
MKKYVLVLLAAAMLFGCAKKSDVKPATAISGKWFISRDTVIETVNSKFSFTDANNIKTGTYIQFNNDGTGQNFAPGDSATPDISSHYTYVYSGSSLTLNYPAQTVGSSSQAAYSQVYKVISVNTSMLVLVYNNTTTDDIGNVNSVSAIEYWNK